MPYKLLFRENWPFSPEILGDILNIEGREGWGKRKTETCKKEKARM